MTKQWFLEAIAADGSRLTYVVSGLPFRVGREADNDLVVNSTSLSRHHAEFSPDESSTHHLRLSDLGSTNGCFVNRVRVLGSERVGENDIVHFGKVEFRLKATEARPAPDSGSSDDGGHTVLAEPGAMLSEFFSPREMQFNALLRGVGLSCVAQPIVLAQGGALYGYELLGRCTHPDLPPLPVHLFHLASQLDGEAALSEAFRAYGIRAIGPKLRGHSLFVNTHPKETFEESFFTAITQTLLDWPELKLVVEIPETAVMAPVHMRELAARLKGIGVRFAYDDFGAGQARLNEIGEVPADIVKFDMALIRDLHLASKSKLRVVRDLVRLVGDLGSITLAEGVEQEEEAQVCRDLGFTMIQGFLTGRPTAIEGL